MQLAKQKLARFPVVPAHFHCPVDLGCGWMHGSISSLLEMTESGPYLRETKCFLQEVSFILKLYLTRCKRSSVPLQVEYKY